MSNRFETKRLLYIFGVLALVLVVTLFVKIPRQKSTLKIDLVKFDTAQVERIVITPKKQEGEEFEFIKGKEGWRVRQGNITAEPRSGAVTNILNDLLAIRPLSLVAVDKSKWGEYDLTDSLGIRVRAENRKGKPLADVMVGKFSYKQVSNPYAGYGGGSINGSSYVRLYGNNEIYSVDGFLTFSFSGGFDEWRNKTLIHATKSDITKISFNFPADSGYVLEKRDNKWYIGEIPADSVKTSGYLGDITYSDGEKFADHFKPDIQPLYKVIIEGNNLLTITLKCWKQDDGKYILNSSLNPDSYFESNTDGVITRILKPGGYFKSVPRP